MREDRTSGSMSGMWRWRIAGLVMHRCAYAMETDGPSLRDHAGCRLCQVMGIGHRFCAEKLVIALICQEGYNGSSKKWLQLDSSESG